MCYMLAVFYTAFLFVARCSYPSGKWVGGVWNNWFRVQLTESMLEILNHARARTVISLSLARKATVSCCMEEQRLCSCNPAAFGERGRFGALSLSSVLIKTLWSEIILIFAWLEQFNNFLWYLIIGIVICTDKSFYYITCHVCLLFLYGNT